MPNDKAGKKPTEVKITIFIPKELGLTQKLVEEHKDKFMVEVQGTLGSTTPRIVINPIDTPSNDY